MVLDGLDVALQRADFLLDFVDRVRCLLHLSFHAPVRAFEVRTDLGNLLLLFDLLVGSSVHGFLVVRVGLYVLLVSEIFVDLVAVFLVDLVLVRSLPQCLGKAVCSGNVVN